MRRTSRNPHQLALGPKLAATLKKAGAYIAEKWRTVLFDSRDRIATIAVIETSVMKGDLRLVVGIRVMDDYAVPWTAALLVDDAVENEGAMNIPLVLNMSRRLSAHSITSVLRHEMLHLIFWAKARTGMPPPLNVEELGLPEVRRFHQLSESEYMAYVLTFVQALEDELERLWRDDPRAARQYAEGLLRARPLPESLFEIIEANRELVDSDNWQPLQLYIDNERYAVRFADAIRYSIEDKLARLGRK